MKYIGFSKTYYLLSFVAICFWSWKKMKKINQNCPIFLPFRWFLVPVITLHSFVHPAYLRHCYVGKIILEYKLIPILNWIIYMLIPTYIEIYMTCLSVIYALFMLLEKNTLFSRKFYLGCIYAADLLGFPASHGVPKP